ncbi:MAG: M48 family metallopeptidase [bacterium]|nr:M48 family metallopeptidase [bacterium]
MSVAKNDAPLEIHRWPSERLLRVIVVVAAIAMWALLAMSLIGAIYALMIGVFFFFAHLAFIYHLRGNAVRLGPEQFPELHARVEQIALRVGLKETPDAYLVQAGGDLNAMATKFFGRNFIVLYSDLVDACGENEAARDFIIAHELGHVHAGHLSWRWLLLPGLFIPFLGQAYSRACEYTCDRYGFGSCGESETSLDGLCVLAAGGKQGPLVNRRALVAQSLDIDTPWMTIARWLSSHPPIAHRIAELQPSLVAGDLSTNPAKFGALAILVALVGVPVASGGALSVGVWPAIQTALEQSNDTALMDDAVNVEDVAVYSPEEAEAFRLQIEREIVELVAAVESHQERTGELPADVETLYEEWSRLNPGGDLPRDPYQGEAYIYQTDTEHFAIVSLGASLQSDDDDLYYSSVNQPQ